MDAKPLLVEIGRALEAVGLEAVLIGNAAAALQGAPLTTVDFDFLFRRSPRNLTKLKAFAERLGATILRPYYPASDFFRVMRDDDGRQVGFMATVHGLRSFEGVRDRGSRLVIEGVPVTAASLGDLIKSKRAAGRPRARPGGAGCPRKGARAVPAEDGRAWRPSGPKVTAPCST